MFVCFGFRAHGRQTKNMKLLLNITVDVDTVYIIDKTPYTFSNNHITLPILRISEKINHKEKTSVSGIMQLL